MMGRQDRDQRQLFYEFSLDEMIPMDHLLRRIDGFATAILADSHDQLKVFYSDVGPPSVDLELMIRVLLVGSCYGIRAGCARKWRCILLTAGSASSISTTRFRTIRHFSVNRLGRFREGEVLRHIFERGIEANASRYHGKAPGELD